MKLLSKLSNLLMVGETSPPEPLEHVECELLDSIPKRYAVICDLAYNENGMVIIASTRMTFSSIEDRDACLSAYGSELISAW